MEKKINFLFMVFTFPIVMSFDSLNRYCTVPRCRNGTHTMCRYPDTEPHIRCDRIIRAGLTENEKERILFLHIYYRSWVYTGQESRGAPGPQPPSLRDVILEWDDELAAIAQRWVQQCMIFSDICRNVERFYVGQNYIAEDFDEDMDEELQLEYLQELIDIWYNEVVRFNRFHVHRYSRSIASDTLTFHYTQMVWANTTKLGCGAIRYHRIWYPVPKILLACNYGPSGNSEGQLIYETLE